MNKTIISNNINISDYEKNIILKDFPKIELSYENIIHKKVYDYDIMIAIPEGISCFLWFNTYKDQNVCYLLELDGYKHVKNITIVKCSFIDSFSYGTIFYGTLFQYKQNKCFTIEDIFYYKGKKYQDIYINKLKLFHHILINEISSLSLFHHYLIIALPIISFDKNFNKLLNNIEILPYKIKNIQFHNILKSTKSYYVMKYFKPGNKLNSNSIVKTVIFKISPDIQNDIYNLHTYENGKFIFYDIAYIPDIKTSILMNKLFRNIKENANLDLLEESDDEEEFENNKEDKFVFLNKSFKMHCIYNSKFKKWTPINVVDRKDKIVTLKELNNL
jgi:hypothetical protein